jgi:3',5'-cyclic AMP phosphodiesterase CpdA
MNSVVVRKDDWDFGEITGSQLLKVEAELNGLRHPRASFFRMAVFHHHLFEVPTIYQANSADRIVSNQGLILRHFIRNKIRLVLHGHSHYGAGYKYQPYFFEETRHEAEPIFVFSTGTLSGDHKATAQYSYQCNILRLLREESVVSRGVVIPLRLVDDSLEWRALPGIELDLSA